MNHLRIGIIRGHGAQVGLINVTEIKKETIDSKSQIMKDAVNDATSKLIISEIRFTAKSNNIYAYVCSWNRKVVLIKSLALGQLGTIQKVDLLGTSQKIKWKQTPQALLITMSTYAVKEIPVVGFRIKMRK